MAGQKIPVLTATRTSAPGFTSRNVFSPLEALPEDDADFATRLLASLGIRPHVFLFMFALQETAAPFQLQEFFQGVKIAKEKVAKFFSDADYRLLEQVCGPRVLTACRGTHALAADMDAKASWAVEKIHKIEIVDVFDRWDTAPQPAGVPGENQSAVEKWLVVDVQFVADEIFQFWIKSSEDGEKKELLVPDMANPVTLKCRWRFERPYTKSPGIEEQWMLVDILNAADT